MPQRLSGPYLPGAKCLAPSLTPQPPGVGGWQAGSWGVSQHPGGLQLAEAHRWLQLVGQGGEDLVELLIALGLAALSPTAAPQQPQLELSAEDLQQLRSALETWREGESVSWDGMGTLRLWDAPSGAGLEPHTGEGKGLYHPHRLPCSFTSALVW